MCAVMNDRFDYTNFILDQAARDIQVEEDKLILSYFNYGFYNIYIMALKYKNSVSLGRQPKKILKSGTAIVELD